MTIQHTDIESTKRGYRAIIRVQVGARPRTIRANKAWTTWELARVDVALMVEAIRAGSGEWRRVGGRR